ncbi:hypothetical protein [Nocardioides convexus]|uniref:hypothetical protein n=1 Tax=Nocardioides convexus TaxID=2712224 RepID=UPI0024181C76|nr:hypothetical protein [Nocardioides convexus]
MLGNRRVDTKPEVAIRSALHRAGLRFRKDYRLDLGGARLRPDIAFTRAKVAVFVDGCFWHACPVHGTQPRSNADYWTPKAPPERRARPRAGRSTHGGGLDRRKDLGARVDRRGGPTGSRRSCHRDIDAA